MLITYITLTRPFTLLAPFIGFLACSVAALHETTGHFTPAASLTGAMSCVLLNAASNIFNQLTDIDVDKVNKPYRPLPSGKCTPAQAWTAWACLTALSFILGFSVNAAFLVILLAAFILTTAYSARPLRLHGRGFFGNLTIGVVRGLLLFVAGWVSASPHFDAKPWAAGTIMALFLCGASTTKDFSDMKGDKMYGVITLPVKYGAQNAAYIMAPFLVLPYLMIPFFVSSGALPRASLGLALLAFYGLYILYLVLRKSGRFAVEKNHISWVHMYLMLMATQIGFAVSFMV